MFNRIKKNIFTAAVVGLMLFFGTRPAEAGVLKFLERTMTFPVRATGYVIGLVVGEFTRGGFEAADDLD